MMQMVLEATTFAYNPRLKIRVISVQKKQNADDTDAKATRICPCCFVFPRQLMGSC